MMVRSRQICRRRFGDARRCRAAVAVPLVDQSVLRDDRLGLRTRLQHSSAAVRAHRPSFSFSYHIIVVDTRQFVAVVLRRFFNVGGFLFLSVDAFRSGMYSNVVDDRRYDGVGYKSRSDVDLGD